MVLFPNAKINIGLYVTRRRPDGFHDIETVFYPVGLRDILEIHEGKGKGGRCSFTSTGIPMDCLPERNLVTRAYDLLAGDRELPPVEVHLHKIIPSGAGLGGGSADAAFMLTGLNRLFALGLSEERLMAYAARLGSDCAFFVRNEPVFAFGKGELMEPVGLSLSGYRLAIVKPERGVSTPDAYRGIVPRAAMFDAREVGTLPAREWKGRVRNDFERVVIPQVPEIGEIKERLEAMGALYVSMTGSGSAVYALFDRPVDTRGEFPGCFTWTGEDGAGF